MTDTSTLTYADLCKLYWKNESGWLSLPRSQAAEIGRLYNLWYEEYNLSDKKPRRELRVIFDVTDDRVKLTGIDMRPGCRVLPAIQTVLDAERGEEIPYKCPRGLYSGAIDVTPYIQRALLYDSDVDLRTRNRVARATVKALESAFEYCLENAV